MPLRMPIAATIAMCVWVVLYSLNVKGFDALLVAVAILLIAATATVISGFKPGDKS